MRGSRAVISVAALLAVTGATAGGAGGANSRPRYGGTLRVEVPGLIRSLNPLSVPADPLEAATRAALLPMVFETLVRVDAVSGLQPLLADSWQSDAQQRRWRFRLAARIRLHDGTALAPPDVASALRAADTWTVRDTTDGVEIESPEPAPDLPWELADPRRAIAISRGGAAVLGTGPFRVSGWEPGRRLVLAAHDGYREGRPFVDGVAVEMGRPFGDELASLEVGRTDIVRLLPQDVRRVSERRLRVAASRPRDLVAIVFDTRRPAASNEHLRGAVALAIDRDSICTVLLQHQGDPARALLPDWLSGYASIFPARYDRAAARAIAASLPVTGRTVSLQYPPADPTAAAIADRVAVDAREVGLTVRIAPSPGAGAPPPDARLVHIAIDLANAPRALGSLAASLGLDRDGLRDSPPSLEGAARFEQALLEGDIVVPLVHMPLVYGLGPRVAGSNAPIVTPAGALDLASAWLRGGAS